MIKNPKSFGAFKKDVVDRKILRAERKGKNILLHLSGKRTLLIHQKLTGHLLYGNWKDKFIHLIFFLSKGRRLALSDMRKFAKILLWPSDKLAELEDIKQLGPDPLDKNFTFKKFLEILKNKKGKIKQVLMDQKIISGIGNIYSDEILWLAGVHPLKKVQKLEPRELKKIYGSLGSVLKKAVRARGDSIVDYRDIFGRKGRYQKMHSAYQMTGEKCKKNDGGIIKKIKIGGRSGHFCPIHQKL